MGLVIWTSGGCGQDTSTEKEPGKIDGSTAEIIADAGPSEIERLGTRVLQLEAKIAKLEKAQAINVTSVAAEIVSSAGPEMLGPPGPQGNRGFEGPTGPAGPAGVVGPIGPSGALGPVGARGELGASGPPGSQGIQGLQGSQGLQGTQGIQGPAGPVGPEALLSNKSDFQRHEKRIEVGPSLIGSAVAQCKQPTDLVLSGGCAVSPIWQAGLVITAPFAVSDRRNIGGWRCDYRNLSADKEIQIVAEVYCAPKK